MPYRKSKLKVGRSQEEEFRILARRAEVSRLYAAGMKKYKIAEKLGLNKVQITRDIQAVEEEWMQSALMDIDKRKARELAKVDELEATYREAWDKSCEDAEISTQKQVGKGDNARLEATLRKEGQSGNPAFLAGVMACIAKRCEIIDGLKATNRLEITDAQLDAQIERELERLAATRQKAATGVPPQPGANAGPGATGSRA
jgi:transposase